MVANTSKVNTLEELSKAVDKSGGVLTMSAWRIRDMCGHQRIGVRIRSQIEAKLHMFGIECQDPFPSEQHVAVRMFRIGSDVASVIDAVRRPTREADRVLRAFANQKGATAVQKLKDLVKELEYA